MNEINEGKQGPVDLPPLRQAILDAIEAKDYPRDTDFAEVFGAVLIGLIQGLGELLFGDANAQTEAPNEDISPVETPSGDASSAETPSGDTKSPETPNGDAPPAETPGSDTPSPDTREYQESTERKAAEIMAEVFDQETLERWPAMDAAERQAKLEEYYFRLTDMLGIPETKLIIDDLNRGGSEGFTFGCFIPSTGEIYIDYRIFEDPDMLGQTLSTLTHETRHQFQQNVVLNPERYPDVPQVLVEVWTNNMPPPPSNYKDADTYGFETYYSQPIEVDAESFAQSVMIEFMKIINE